MLKITYKSGEVKEVQEPFKVSKEEYQLIEKVEKANDYRKYIKNAFQCFVHSVNFLSRNSVESPFVNCSFFGPPKLRAMIADDNMGWYFQKEDAVDGVPEEALKDCGDQGWIEYLIKIILDLQDIFAEVMDAGDPLHDNRPIEFPVCTVNFSRKVNEDGSVEFVDYDYVEDFCKKHDITRYNIYLSEGQKIASCCFDGGQRIYYYDGDNVVDETFDELVSRFVSGLGQYTIPENERVYKVFDPSTNEKVEITGVLRRDNQWGELVRIELDNGLIIKATPDQLFLDKNSGTMVSAKDICEGFNNLKSSIKISDNSNIITVTIYKSTEPVYDIEVDSKEHTFYLDSESNVIAHNCRLINDVDLFELGGQVNSFGGSALSLGSHRVCTVNMRRIALMCDSWEDYKKRLLQKMDEAEDVLVAHRALLKDLVKKGTQPFISNGWLDLDRMFSTIGLLGYYEAAQDLTERFGEHDYLGEMVDLMEAHARELTKERHNINNLEQIPAEAQSSKMCSADHWIFDGPDNEW